MLADVLTPDSINPSTYKTLKCKIGVRHGFSLVYQDYSYCYNDVIIGTIASQITSLMIAFSTIYLDTDQRTHQSSASLAFVRGIHRRPVNSPHKWPVTRKMFPFDDVIMIVCHFHRPDGVIQNSRGYLAWYLTHWGRVTHICVSKLTIIDSDDGLSPGRRRTIIWTNAKILLLGPLGTNSSEILLEIHTFSFKKMRLKVSSAEWRPSCPGLIVIYGPSKYPDQWCC